jgi:hypothetical protein
MMNRMTKSATALALAGALAVTAATPSFARSGRHVAAGIIGFAAGAAIGAAAANANRGYYYGEPTGYYGGYAYEPGYVVEPGYVYESPRRYYRGSRCAVEGAYRPDYSNC